MKEETKTGKEEMLELLSKVKEPRLVENKKSGKTYLVGISEEMSKNMTPEIAEGLEKITKMLREKS